MSKCQIYGCENDAEHICRPGMCSGMYCRKHFEEIYNDRQKHEVVKVEEGRVTWTAKDEEEYYEAQKAYREEHGIPMER